MTTYVVTTTTNSIDDGDGALSLREAVALANANPNSADVITFDISSNPVSTVYISDSAIEIAENTTLTIDGDLNDDGITDIILWAGSNHHLTIDSGAQVTLTRPRPGRRQQFFDSGSLGTAPDGAAGPNGAHGYGKSDILSDSDLYILDFTGLDGEDGAQGANGERGTDGADQEVQAGAIVNYGTLNLVRVGFGNNDATGGVGGNGGNGGNGGSGGQGGEGIARATDCRMEATRP